MPNPELTLERIKGMTEEEFNKLPDSEKWKAVRICLIVINLTSSR